MLLGGGDWLCYAEPSGFEDFDSERDWAGGGFGGGEEFVVLGDFCVEDEFTWLCGEGPSDGVEVWGLGGEGGSDEEEGAHGLELYLRGGEDVAGFAVLDESDDAEAGGDGWHGEFYGAVCTQAFGGADGVKGADDGGVLQGLARVFAFGDFCFSVVFGYGYEDCCAIQAKE